MILTVLLEKKGLRVIHLLEFNLWGPLMSTQMLMARINYWPVVVSVLDGWRKG